VRVEARSGNHGCTAEQAHPDWVRRLIVLQVLAAREGAPAQSEAAGTSWPIGCLRYGCGLRLKESARVRVRDLAFPHETLKIVTRRVAVHKSATRYPLRRPFGQQVPDRGADIGTVESSSGGKRGLKPAITGRMDSGQTSSKKAPEDE